MKVSSSFKLPLTLLAVCCLLLGKVAYAEEQPLLRPPLLFALSKIELSDSTKQKIAQILVSHRGEGQKMIQWLQQARMELSSTVRDNETSEQDVLAAAKKLAATEEKIAVEVFRVSREIKATLTKSELDDLALVRVTPETSAALSSTEVLGAQVEDWIKRYSVLAPNSENPKQ